MWLCGDRDLAEDLSQEAFVLAWRKLASFRGDSAFGSWLYRIVTNSTLSYLRKQSPFRHSLDIDDLVEEGRADNTDEKMNLEAAINKLPKGAGENCVCSIQLRGLHPRRNRVDA